MQVLEIKALIGYFDLDPNRAVSLVLLAFAAQPGRRAYLQLFELFTNTATEQTLGFLFQHHAGPGGETPENLFAVAVTLIQVGVCCGALNPKPLGCCLDSTPPPLPRLPSMRAALSRPAYQSASPVLSRRQRARCGEAVAAWGRTRWGAQAGVVRLEAVMGHLAPGDAAMRQAAKGAVSALEKEIRGIGVISLSATAAGPVSGSPEPCATHAAAVATSAADAVLRWRRMAL